MGHGDGGTGYKVKIPPPMLATIQDSTLRRWLRLLINLQDSPEPVNSSMILDVHHRVKLRHLEIVTFDLIQNIPAILRDRASRPSVAMQYPLEHLKSTMRNDSEEGPLVAPRRRGRQFEIGLHFEETIQLLALICIDWEGIGLLKTKIFDIRWDQTGVHRVL
jgi:hypothetical protein